MRTLAERLGINASWTDIWGGDHEVPESTLAGLVRSFGIDLSGGAGQALREFEAEQAAEWLPPVAFSYDDEALALDLRLPAEHADSRLGWTLRSEQGEHRSGACAVGELTPQHGRAGPDLPAHLEVRLPLPCPAAGYHRLEVQLEPAGRSEGEPPLTGSCPLIIAPRRCYRPQAPEHRRLYGLSTQLYALRSRRNWGIGDYTDLLVALEQTARMGGSVLGVNPLHTLFPTVADAERASPYSPSTRLFLNTLCLDVEAVEDFTESAPARERVGSSEFQLRLRALRAAERVDYAGVAAAKQEILELLYRHFRRRHLGTDSVRGRAFAAFVAEGGRRLELQARFEALQIRLQAEDPGRWGWPAWPQEFQDPAAAAVEDFARRERYLVDYRLYLLWQAELQLARVAERARALGMPVGLYLDLAVSIDRGGAEAWAARGEYALDASIGAPPDDFNLGGQDWGLPPLNPLRLRQSGFVDWIATLRANMRHAGALRVDHVMALLRLFWIPAGGTPGDGAYVQYPLRELLGILALESQRARCLIVGEDLGTVPEAVRTALAEADVLSYRLLMFEREEDGFRPPEAYPERALVAVSTHDLPTLAGYWLGRDIRLRETLGLIPDPQLRAGQLLERAGDRVRLLLALEAAGRLPENGAIDLAGLPPLDPPLAAAVHGWLARSPAQLLMVQPEDVLGETEQANLPGTTDQYPNWRRKLSLDVEDWADDERFGLFAHVLAAERGAAAPAAAPPSPVAVRRPAGCGRIPRATYRLQLNADFDFSDATALVPYLAALGISDLYLSPFLKARPGSTHGYDIVDHGRLNPELGGDAAYARLCRAAEAAGLGQILDMVPNHMGVMGADNAWWLDVLEHGQAAAHADFFDIDWSGNTTVPPGKLLLPVLGDSYGAVLEAGTLQLRLDAAAGTLAVWYHEHCFPLDPQSYPQVLARHSQTLAARLVDEAALMAEYESLCSAFGRLPDRATVDAEQRAERRRDAAVLQRQLAALLARSADLGALVAEAVTAVNGSPGDPASFDELHHLLDGQAWRLAFWRVAQHAINYRRFFDINDLAGLRMEREDVFETTHRHVFELLREGRLHGLRLDHPDGLYDPLQYVQRLQDRFGALCGASGDPQPLYLLVEKILSGDESLPHDWPVHGTTGYETGAALIALLVDPQGEPALDALWHEFGSSETWPHLARECKRLIMEGPLSSELGVLAGQLARIAASSRHTRDLTRESLRQALLEVVAHFGVYRSYLTADPAAEVDDERAALDAAVRATRTLVEDSVLDFVHGVLTLDAAHGRPAEVARAITEVALRFQQYSAPVVAKGVEDTALYRYLRLSCLNEVGCEPDRFGLSLRAFHARVARRARHWPHAMNALSTHDSKRSEDVRARIAVLSELAPEWREQVTRWRAAHGAARSAAGPAPQDEYLCYQTLVGIWPLTGTPDAELPERLAAYLVKAAREAKQHTGWLQPNAAYEQALQHFVATLLRPEPDNLFPAEIARFSRRAAHFGLLNALTQHLLRLCLPGVPDLYQGSELWTDALVDPDNRRPVDFARRRALLETLAAAEVSPELAAGLLSSRADGRIKLHYTRQALALRQARPGLLGGAGEYLPLRASGDRAEHVIAFARRHEGSQLVVVAPRWFARLGGGEPIEPLGEVWGESELMLPDAAAHYRDCLSGARVSARRGRLRLSEILGVLPHALLLAE